MPLLLTLVVLLCTVLVLPVLALAGAWVGASEQTWGIWQHLLSTVLPGYALTSITLALSVGVGVALLGCATAAAVTLFDFPGRRTLEWMLLLPLAMPAYVLAYAYTDVLQTSGALQVWLRAQTGWEGPLWPDVRSVWGAGVLFVFCLYPYVYLLVRTALTERGVHLMEVARLLGADLPRRIWAVALPMARPAMAAGVALAMMETLADYGVAGYFGLTTFTTGIYSAWLSMDNAQAAAQLATVLLAMVAILVAFEQSAQARLRFAGTRQGALHGQEARPIELHGSARVWAWLVCGVPVLLGFVLPVAALVVMLLRSTSEGGGGDTDGGVGTSLLPWSRFAQWAFNSFWLALWTALLATAFALALAWTRRRTNGRLLPLLARLVGLGYAVPGAVVVVGILLPTGWLRTLWPDSPAATLITATVLGLLYAYLVRFSAVALQSVDAGYARVSMSFDESARMLGQGGWPLWRRVHWPALRRATFTAALLVFVDVMKELPATLVLRPFNWDTLAVAANQLARDERLAEAALPSLAMVLVGLVPVLLLSRAAR